MIEQDMVHPEEEYFFNRLYDLVENDVGTEDIIQELERLNVGKERGRAQIIKDIHTAANVLLKDRNLH